MSKVTASAPPAVRQYLNAAGNKVRPIAAPSAPEEVTGTTWFVAQFTPTGTSANVDVFNNTSSGVSSLILDGPATGLALTGGKFFLLTAGRKAGTSAALVDNLITVSVNSVEIGRIYVDTNTGTCGWCAFFVPGDREDARVNLTGTSTTGDLVFALTAADPSLTIHIECIGGD